MTFLDRRNFLKGAGVAVVGALTARTLPAIEPKAPRLRVAQLGVEHPHAPGKWETLQRRTDLFDCAGVWEPDPAVRKQVESHPTFRGVHWLTESELFGDAGIQAVLVERELPDLLGTAHRCLERGWHVHVDKPPGADLDGLRSVQTLAATKRLVLQMGYMWRYHPAFTFCFDLLHRGVLGRVFEVNGHLGKMMPASRRPQLAEMYHGSMMALGSHLLDLAVAVKGVPEHVSAFRRRTYPERDAFYDNELAVLEYPDALATIRSMLTEVGRGAAAPVHDLWRRRDGRSAAHRAGPRLPDAAAARRRIQSWPSGDPAAGGERPLRRDAGGFRTHGAWTCVGARRIHSGARPRRAAHCLQFY